MFSCCDQLSKRDLNLAFDCKKGLDGGGYCPPDDENLCESNYLNGVEEVKQSKLKQLNPKSSSDSDDADTNLEDEGTIGWIATIFIFLFVIGVAFFIGYVIVKTSCCTKSLCPQKPAPIDIKEDTVVEKELQVIDETKVIAESIEEDVEDEYEKMKRLQGEKDATTNRQDSNLIEAGRPPRNKAEIKRQRSMRMMSQDNVLNNSQTQIMP